MAEKKKAAPKKKERGIRERDGKFYFRYRGDRTPDLITASGGSVPP
jgi:hypothetical protein